MLQLVSTNYPNIMQSVLLKNKPIFESAWAIAIIVHYISKNWLQKPPNC